MIFASVDSIWAYVTFVRYNIKVPYGCHDCSFWHVKRFIQKL